MILIQFFTYSSLHFYMASLFSTEVKHTTAKKETEWTGSRKVTFVIII